MRFSFSRNIRIKKTQTHRRQKQRQSTEGGTGLLVGKHHTAEANKQQPRWANKFTQQKTIPFLPPSPPTVPRLPPARQPANPPSEADCNGNRKP